MNGFLERNAHHSVKALGRLTKKWHKFHYLLVLDQSEKGCQLIWEGERDRDRDKESDANTNRKMNKKGRMRERFRKVYETPFSNLPYNLLLSMLHVRINMSHCKWVDQTVTNIFTLLIATATVSHFSCVQLCATPEMAAHQAPLSLGLSGQEH